MESREMSAPSRLPCVWGLPVVLEGGTAGSGQGRQGSSNNTDRAINFFSNCSLVRRIEAKVEKKMNRKKKNTNSEKNQQAGGC